MLLGDDLIIKQQRAVFQGLSGLMILRILTSNLVFFKPQLMIHEIILEHLKIS